MLKLVQFMAAKIYKKLTRLLASEKFFWGVIAFFVFESVWIAISNKYPALFDEAYHFGLIKLHAQQWLPFFTHQPPDSNVYGAVVRDPSYLYHYILSIPYRTIAHFVHSVGGQVVLLRLINIAFFAIALVIFRRVLNKTKSSKAMINTVFLFVALTPIAPFLASQINYDNLLMLGVAIALLFTLKVQESLKRKKIGTTSIFWLLLTCFLTSIVKYSFLPIFVAISIYLSWQLARVYKRHLPSIKITNLISRVKKLSISQILLLFFVFLAFCGFFERYGVNIIKYRTPVPQCNVVLNVKDCEAYPPWYRNYQLRQHPITQSQRNNLSQPKVKKLMSYSTYTGDWVNITLYDMSQAGVASRTSVAPPIPLPWVAINLVAVGGGILLLIYLREIIQDKKLKLLVGITIFYFLVLWLQNFSVFLHIGFGLAIQGRYWVIFFPVIYLVIIKSFSLFLKNQTIKIAAFFITLLCMLSGGGAASYIMRTNPNAYWDNPTIIRANLDAQKILSPFVIKNW